MSGFIQLNGPGRMNAQNARPPPPPPVGGRPPVGAGGGGGGGGGGAAGGGGGIRPPPMMPDLRPPPPRFIEISDITRENLTENQMREDLCDFEVVSFERIDESNFYDDDGKPQKPTWKKVRLTRVPGYDKKLALKAIRRLDKETESIDLKRNKLSPDQLLQIDKALYQFAQSERDDLFQWSLAQIDHQLKPLGKGVGRDGKKKNLFERTLITAYFRRAPKPRVDVWNLHKNVYSRASAPLLPAPVLPPGGKPPMGGLPPLSPKVKGGKVIMPGDDRGGSSISGSSYSSSSSGSRSPTTSSFTDSSHGSLHKHKRSASRGRDYRRHRSRSRSRSRRNESRRPYGLASPRQHHLLDHGVRASLPAPHLMALPPAPPPPPPQIPIDVLQDEAYESGRAKGRLEGRSELRGDMVFTEQLLNLASGTYRPRERSPPPMVIRRRPSFRAVTPHDFEYERQRDLEDHLARFDIRDVVYDHPRDRVYYDDGPRIVHPYRQDSLTELEVNPFAPLPRRERHLRRKEDYLF